MTQRVSFKVHGTVQGVFFRKFTQEKALGYGLTGFVQNTRDGKVTGEAQGEEASVERLLKDINEGPSHAHVVKVEKESMEVKANDRGFETR